MKQLQSFPGKRLGFVGLSKNAGKTTALNHTARLLANDHNLGFLSMGVDGEKRDAWSGREKPAVWVPEGSIVATAGLLLEERSSNWEVISRTDCFSLLGEVFLAKALTTCEVKLAGIRGNNEISLIQQQMSKLGVSMLLHDGAYDRKGFTIGNLVDGIILVVGASGFSHLESVLQKLRQWITWNRLPVIDRKEREWADGYLIWARSGKLLVAEEKYSNWLKEIRRFKQERKKIDLFLPGALTRGILSTCLDWHIDTMILSTPSHLFLTLSDYRLLRKYQVSLQVLHAPQILAVGINPTSVEGHYWNPYEFQQEVAKIVKPIPVYDFSKL